MDGALSFFSLALIAPFLMTLSRSPANNLESAEHDWRCDRPESDIQKGDSVIKICGVENVSM